MERIPPALRSSRLWKWVLIITAAILLSLIPRTNLVEDPATSIPKTSHPRWPPWSRTVAPSPTARVGEKKKTAAPPPTTHPDSNASAPTRQPTTTTSTPDPKRQPTESPTLASKADDKAGNDTKTHADKVNETETASRPTKVNETAKDATSHTKANDTATTKMNHTTPVSHMNDTAEANDTAVKDGSVAPTTTPRTNQSLVPSTTTAPPISNTSAASLIPPYDKSKAEAFVGQHCILQNTAWFPNSTTDWQLRAPRFMVIGVRDAGSRDLALLLQQHSLVQKTRTLELDFFSQQSFDKAYIAPSSGMIHVWPGRQRMYARDYPTSTLKKDSSLVSMDATPHYIFYPHRILCVCPWIQMVVVLRNPAHRLYASFQRAQTLYHFPGSFETYVGGDMNLMERVGLIGHNNELNQTVDDTWARYLRLSPDAPVGRSLYEIQLRQWFQALREMGRDPQQAMKIVSFRDLTENSSGVLQDVWTFLGLPPQSVALTSPPSPLVVEDADKPTMRKLQKFFRPYNRQLYKLLGKEWDGMWDHDDDT